MSAICWAISALFLAAAIVAAATAGPPRVDIGPPHGERHTTIVGPED